MPQECGGSPCWRASRFFFLVFIPLLWGGSIAAPSVAIGCDPLALRVAPNPARAGNPVQFTGPAVTAPRAFVFSSEGPLVRVLQRAGGASEIGFAWDGREADGRPANAGIYLVRIDGSRTPRTARLVLVHGEGNGSWSSRSSKTAATT